MRNLKPTLLLMILLLVLGGAVAAQEAVAKSNKTPFSQTHSLSAEPLDNNEGVPVMDNPDAGLVAKLSALFPKSTNQQWRQLSNGYYVTFINNGEKANASFSLQGDMNYVITNCKMEHLPTAFRNTILKKYSGYKLANAIEINAYNAVAHQAILENASGFVTLKATSQGIEEVRYHKKTK